MGRAGRGPEARGGSRPEAAGAGPAGGRGAQCVRLRSARLVGRRHHMSSGGGDPEQPRVGASRPGPALTMSVCCCFFFRDYGSSKRKSGKGASGRLPLRPPSRRRSRIPGPAEDFLGLALACPPCGPAGPGFSLQLPPSPVHTRWAVWYSLLPLAPSPAGPPPWDCGVRGCLEKGLSPPTTSAAGSFTPGLWCPLPSTAVTSPGSFPRCGRDGRVMETQGSLWKVRGGTAKGVVLECSEVLTPAAQTFPSSPNSERIPLAAGVGALRGGTRPGWRGRPALASA